MGYNIFQAGCTPHVETPPKVRASDDTNVINSLNFCTSAPRAPGCGRKVGPTLWELSSHTGRTSGTIPPATLPWELLTAVEESWDGYKGTWIKGSRRVLLISPSWHCAGDETQPLGVFPSPRNKNTDKVSNITSQFSLASHPTACWGNASSVLNLQKLPRSLAPSAVCCSTHTGLHPRSSCISAEPWRLTICQTPTQSLLHNLLSLVLKSSQPFREAAAKEESGNELPKSGNLSQWSLAVLELTARIGP